MTITFADEIGELEECFLLEVPCGGNRFPAHRICPDGAAAVMVKYCCCFDTPQSFKCAACYARWLKAHSAFTSQRARCGHCGLVMPVEDWYRPL